MDRLVGIRELFNSWCYMIKMKSTKRKAKIKLWDTPSRVSVNLYCIHLAIWSYYSESYYSIVFKPKRKYNHHAGLDNPVSHVSLTTFWYLQFTTNKVIYIFHWALDTRWKRIPPEFKTNDATVLHQQIIGESHSSWTVGELLSPSWEFTMNENKSETWRHSKKKEQIMME